jgi:deoxyribose-phosphate aldolase
VRQLCYKAIHPHDKLSDLPTVAAICVYPSQVNVARKALKGTNINIASVATAFPSGQVNLEAKLSDTKYAVEEGADEIDMVISRGEFLAGNYTFIYDEIAAVKEACGKAHLKVILETGELETLDNVRKASEIAMYAGADFIKTSTGKVQPAATMPVTYVMLNAIKEYYLKTGKKIGMKPAGGISTSKIALQYLVMLNEVLGEQWMNKDYFRFGASSLTNDVLMQLVKAETGVYQSINYFSKD